MYNALWIWDLDNFLIRNILVNLERFSDFESDTNLRLWRTGSGVVW
jgi:hypothetical protein